MRHVRILVLLALMLLLTACGSRKTTDISEQYYSFTDAAGTAVTLEKRPEKVAVLFSSYAEIWSLAGGSAAITVGESVERGFADESVILVDDGAGKQIDHERLLAAKPDFIIGSADIKAQVEACRVMAESGIPSALFRVDTFEDYLSMLKICTDITGSEAAYARYGMAVKEEVDRIKAETASYLAEHPEEREILFIRSGSQYSATKAKRAPENFVCIMLDELGAVNIADEAEVLLDGLSLETVLLRNPDCIFLTTMGSEEAAKAYIEDLFTQDGWRNLDAVKNGNYHFLPKELFHFKPNARWAEAYAFLANLLYPELNIHA